MPPTASRPHPVDLWLCGHHYRASGAALTKSGAAIEDLTAPESRPQDDKEVAPAL